MKDFVKNWINNRAIALGLALWVGALGICANVRADESLRGRIDVALIVVGRGYSWVDYSCQGGTSLRATYVPYSTEGEKVEFWSDGELVASSPRYLSPVDAEISQCVSGKSSRRSFGATFCYSAPEVLSSIDLGTFYPTNRFVTEFRCSIDKTRRHRD